MYFLIKVKKVGNHWYPCLEHDDPIDLMLDPKMDRLLSFLDKDHCEELHFLLMIKHNPLVLLLDYHHNNLI